MSPFPPGWRGTLRALVELAKVRITVAVTLTTALGYVLHTGSLDAPLAGVLAGMFLLAGGSAALNQWQEAHLDARMNRTRHRPIPAGAIDPTLALFGSTILGLLGLFLLTTFGRQNAAVLALCAGTVLWYNGLYTYLKRRSAFAAVPGAVIGGIPPLVGYVAAGGPLLDHRILPVMLFMFVWQVPHFWLLLLRVGDQYARADLPSLTHIFSPAQLRRVTFMWVLAAAAAGMTLPAVSPATVTLPWNLIIVLASAWLAIKATALLRSATDTAPYRRAFVDINLFALIVIASLLANALHAPLADQTF